MDEQDRATDGVGEARDSTINSPPALAVGAGAGIAVALLTRRDRR